MCTNTSSSSSMVAATSKQTVLQDRLQVSWAKIVQEKDKKKSKEPEPEEPKEIVQQQ